MHTLSQTRDWVILCDSGNFKADADEMMGGERTVTTDDEVPVWLIRKEQLEGTPVGHSGVAVCFTMSPPNGHYYARYDDTDGISVVWEGMDLMDLGLYMKPDDNDVNGNPVDPAAVGLYNMAMAPETITEVTFDPNSGKVIEQGIYKEDWTFNLQLSGMDWSLEGLSHPTLHHVTYQGCRPGNISERAAKMYEGRIDLDQVREETPGRAGHVRAGQHGAEEPVWEYTDTSDHITSPTFAPRSAGDGTERQLRGPEAGGHDGYVVQPVLSDGGLRVDLFDAANVGAGPIATLKGTNNETVPVILHSAWMPQPSGRVDADRLRFSDELSDEAMATRARGVPRLDPRGRRGVRRAPLTHPDPPPPAHYPPPHPVL